MSKNKNKFYIVLTLILSLICTGIFYLNNKSNTEKDIPIIREYIFDLLSLSRIDINNYSIDTNFKEEHSSKSSYDIWSESMSFNYINSNKNKNYQSKKTIALSNEVSDIVKEIHIKNIDFLKNNLIPLESLESDKSNEELDKYISEVDKDKEVLLQEITLLENEIRAKINQYIVYANKYDKQLSIESEEEKFEDYFKKEYEEILNKQIDLKIKELLK